MKNCWNPDCSIQANKQRFHDKINFCHHCGSKLELVVDPILTTVYVHANQDTLYELGTEMGLDDDAVARFGNTAYELQLHLSVDPVTGAAKLVSVDGMDVVDGKEI